MFIYPATILLSAFLLFLVQPVIAKQILPWFGGSAGVWTTCLVFFQVVLLGGYAYAHWLVRRRSTVQASIHIGLLIVSLIFLPIVPAENWKPAADADPIWRILGLLAATIGAPYFLLASTGPLLQKWFSISEPDPIRRAKVYRLFALSNFGSLLGLVAYPFAVEPYATSRTQSLVWSIAYAAFALFCAACAWRSRTHGAQPASTGTWQEDSAAPSVRRRLFWLACAALGSALLLAVTSHITQNIASIPFLWVLPLSLYLVSFVVVFEGRGGRGWYARGLWMAPVLAITVAMAWGLGANRAALGVHYAIPLYSVGLFLACAFCHGEIAASKPAPAFLTQFYLAISAGGALGGLLVALVAPRVFDNYWELPIALAGLIALALAICWRDRPKSRSRRHAARFSLFIVGALAALCATAYFGVDYYRFLARDTLAMTRNFYGSLRVRDGFIDGHRVRRLLHGVILHGEQFVEPKLRTTPGSYYGPTSGIGLALRLLRPAEAAKRVASIGLGAGTLAAYGQAGDTYRIYEINDDVVRLARADFTYLSDTRASIEIALGDARLSLERELAAGAFTSTERRYDVVSVDAFSGDAIPVHLLTREALAVYARVLAPDGVIAFHVSNKALKLAPVVQQLAEQIGYTAWEIDDHPSGNTWSASDWVLVTRNHGFLENPEVAAAGHAVEPIAGLRPWTDQFNNLFQILK